MENLNLADTSGGYNIHECFDNTQMSLGKNEIEYKTFDFTVTETKKYTNEDGDEIGVFFGKMATEHRDLGNDIIEPEAFDESIADYKSRKRNIPLYYQHNTNERPIGIIQAKEIKKEGKSWNVKGELNLDTQAGRETYSLLKQGALADLSFGYGIVDADITKAGIRKLKKLRLDEVSVVGKPMNPKATIDEVKAFKAVTPFKDFPIVKDKDGKVDTKFKWDGDAAEKRVRKFVGAEDEPNAKYKAAHMWFDPDKQDNFTGYKLLYVDVIDGKLQVVPRAIFEKAALLRGGRAGLNVSDEDKKKIASHVNKYYDKMELSSPLRDKGIKYLFNDDDELQIVKNSDIDDVEHIVTQKSFEDLLKNSGVFSRQAATYLAKFFNPQTQGEPAISKEEDQKQGEPVKDQEKVILKKLEDINQLINKFVENKNDN